MSTTCEITGQVWRRRNKTQPMTYSRHHVMYNLYIKPHHHIKKYSGLKFFQQIWTSWDAYKTRWLQALRVNDTSTRIIIIEIVNRTRGKTRHCFRLMLLSIDYSENNKTSLSVYHRTSEFCSYSPGNWEFPRHVQLWTWLTSHRRMKQRVENPHV